jgi:hypothetical protein
VEKLEIGIERKTNLVFHLTCILNQRIYPRLTQNLEKTFNGNDIEWIEEKYSRSGISRMSKNERSRKFSYKGGKKGIILLYSRNYVNEEGGHKNRKVGVEPSLVHMKEMVHDMLNMPMNESFPIWLLKQLLCL